MKKFVAVMGFNDEGEESYGEEEAPHESNDEEEARLFKEAVEQWRVEKPAAKIIETNMKWSNIWFKFILNDGMSNSNMLSISDLH